MRVQLYDEEEENGTLPRETAVSPAGRARRRQWESACRRREGGRMNTLPIALEAVDRAEVTILMDNFVDVLLASGADVRRYVQLDISDRNQLIAEHGFSALVTVESDGRRSSVLYDAGLTPQGLTRNLDVLQVPVRDLRAIVISHGHGDHHGGLEGLFERYWSMHAPACHPPGSVARAEGRPADRNGDPATTSEPARSRSRGRAAR